PASTAGSSTATRSRSPSSRTRTRGGPRSPPAPGSRSSRARRGGGGAANAGGFAMRRAILSAAALAPAVAGGGADDKPTSKSVKDPLEKAGLFELYSLEPAADKDPKGFHGYKVLGKTEVKDAKVRKEVLDALYKGIADSDGTAAACFIPR